MYYDLIASLPFLPHFTKADRLPITPLRLAQRLGRLRPEHADQLASARALIRWRAEQLTADTDRSLIDQYTQLIRSDLNAPLREYVEFRMTQQTLLAGIRRQHEGLDMPDDLKSWGDGPRVLDIRRHWDVPFFGLARVYKWLPAANEQVAAGNALGLERLLMDLNWTWLTRRAERNMFGFEAVIAFVFKWDMLQAWLACDAVRAKVRFTELVDKVTYVEHT